MAKFSSEASLNIVAPERLLLLQVPRATGPHPGEGRGTPRRLPVHAPHSPPARRFSPFG